MGSQHDFRRTSPLTGMHESTIDEAGRLLIPRRMREGLGDEFTLHLGPQGSLVVRPADSWVAMLPELERLMQGDSDSMSRARYIAGSAETGMNLDAQGRLRIPKRLREFANLVDRVLIIGCLDRIEVWTPDRYESFTSTPATTETLVTPPQPADQERDVIFISYKREDFDRVAPFLDRIARSGLPVWYDRGIPGGAEWSRLIEERILHCKLLIVFLSHRSVESKWVRREILFADSKNRPVIGIRLDKDVKLQHGLDLVLNQYQMIDASDADFSTEIKRAIEFVRIL